MPLDGTGGVVRGVLRAGLVGLVVSGVLAGVVQAVPVTAAVAPVSATGDPVVPVVDRPLPALPKRVDQVALDAVREPAVKAVWPVAGFTTV